MLPESEEEQVSGVEDHRRRSHGRRGFPRGDWGALCPPDVSGVGVWGKAGLTHTESRSEPLSALLR